VSVPADYGLLPVHEEREPPTGAIAMLWNGFRQSEGPVQGGYGLCASRNGLR
jgi:hypothetical protein